MQGLWSVLAYSKSQRYASKGKFLTGNLHGVKWAKLELFLAVSRMRQYCLFVCFSSLLFFVVIVESFSKCALKPHSRKRCVTPLASFMTLYVRYNRYSFHSPNTSYDFNKYIVCKKCNTSKSPNKSHLIYQCVTCPATFHETLD